MSQPKTSFIPWVLVRNILRDRAVEIEAVVASMPCEPQLLKTPPLLQMLSGTPWPENIVSSVLIKLYLAFVFHAVADTEGRHRGPHFDIAFGILKQQQREAYVNGDTGGPLFLLDYINAYEYFLIRLMHLMKVGGDVSLDLDADGQPPLSYFVLAMAGVGSCTYRPNNHR